MWNKGKQLWTIGPSRDPRWRSISRNEVWTGLGRHLPRIVESAAPLLRIVGATPVHRSRDLSPDFVLIRAACTDAMQLLLQMFGIRGDCKILVCACRELLRPDPGHVVPSKERRATQDVGDGGIALQPALPVSFTQTRGDQRKSGYRLAAKLQRVAALANVIVALRGERALDGESTLEVQRLRSTGVACGNLGSSSRLTAGGHLVTRCGLISKNHVAGLRARGVVVGIYWAP